MPVESNPATKTDTAKRRFYLVWTLIGLGLILYALGFVLEVLSLPVACIVLTMMIVFCLRGIVAACEKRGIPRLLGTTIAYVIMVVVLAAIGMLLFSPIFGFGDQLSSLFESAPVYIQQVSDWVTGLYNRYSHIFDNDTVREWLETALASLSAWASDIARQSASGVVQIGTGIVNVIAALGFALVVAFWILIELPALGREVNRLIAPKYREDADLLHITFTRVMGGYLKATLFQCTLIGVACGVLFTILGIPNSAALGLITGILNILPIIGPWFGGALAAIVGIMISPLIAVIALIGTIVIQQFVYTFVSPKIMQNSVDVHPALTIIVLMVGAAIGTAMGGLGGSLVGMFLAIPAVAVMKSMFVYYFEKRTHRQIVAEDGVFFRGTPSVDGKVDPIADAIAPSPESTSAFKLSDSTSSFSLTGRLSRDEINRRQEEIDAKKRAEEGGTRRGRLGNLPDPSEQKTDEREN